MIKVLKISQTFLTVSAIISTLLGFIVSDKTDQLLYRLNGGMAVVLAVLVVPKIIEDLEK